MLNLEKLGVQHPVSEKIEGNVIAKVLRHNNIEDFAIARWNDKIGRYTLVFDDSLIGIKSIVAVYSQEVEKPKVVAPPKVATTKVATTKATATKAKPKK